MLARPRSAVAEQEWLPWDGTGELPIPVTHGSVPCPLTILKLLSLSHVLEPLFISVVIFAQNPRPSLIPASSSSSHMVLPASSSRASPALLGRLRSALTTLYCDHSFPSCFLHQMLSHLRATSCFSLQSHHCQAERRLKNVRLVSQEEREQAGNHAPPLSPPQRISSGDVSRCSWGSHQLSETNLDHPSK